MVRATHKLLVLSLCALAPLGAYGSDPIRIELGSIQTVGISRVGQRVVTRGCLVDAFPHGIYAAPCGIHNWRQILILDGPFKLFPSEMFCVPCSHTPSVEADLTGRLAEEKNVRAPGTHLILHVERVSNVVVHKP